LPILSNIRYMMGNDVWQKLYTYFLIVDVVEWSWVLDISLSDWCCSVSKECVWTPSREHPKILSALKYNSNTAVLNFQTYINIWYEPNISSNFEIQLGRYSVWLSLA